MTNVVWSVNILLSIGLIGVIYVIYYILTLDKNEKNIHTHIDTSETNHQ